MKAEDTLKVKIKLDPTAFEDSMRAFRMAFASLAPSVENDILRSEIAAVMAQRDKLRLDLAESDEWTDELQDEIQHARFMAARLALEADELRSIADQSLRYRVFARAYIQKLEDGTASGRSRIAELEEQVSNQSRTIIRQSSRLEAVRRAMAGIGATNVD